MLALIALQSILLAQPADAPEPRWPPQPWVFTPSPEVVREAEAEAAGTPGAPSSSLCTADVALDPGRKAGVGFMPRATSVSGLRVRARASARQVRPGEKIELRLAIVNETPRVIGIGIGAFLRARITDRRGDLVWTHPSCPPGVECAIPAIGCGRPVLPGRPLEYAVTWDLTNMKGEPVPPGEYTAFLAVGTHPEPPGSRPVRITVASSAAPRTAR